MCYCKIFKGQASSIVSLIYKKLCAKFTEFLESRKIVFTDRNNNRQMSSFCFVLR